MLGSSRPVQVTAHFIIESFARPDLRHPRGVLVSLLRPAEDGGLASAVSPTMSATQAKLMQYLPSSSRFPRSSPHRLSSTTSPRPSRIGQNFYITPSLLPRDDSSKASAGREPLEPRRGQGQRQPTPTAGGMFARQRDALPSAKPAGQERFRPGPPAGRRGAALPRRPTRDRRSSVRRGVVEQRAAKDAPA